MPFNVSTFKSNLEKYGYIQNNKFEVYVRPPNILLGKKITGLQTEHDVFDIVKLLKFRIEDIKIPGVTLYNADVFRYGIGPSSKYPFSNVFNEISMTMVADQYGYIYKFWHHWLRSIFEFNGLENTQNSQVNRIPTYTAEYKDNYSTIIQIIVYDNEGNIVSKYNLYDAFPIAIRDSALAWEDNVDLLNVSVNLTFKEFTLVESTLTPEDKVEILTYPITYTINNN